MDGKKWRCKRCGYITEIKIETCPVCGAPWSEFEEMAATKSGLNWADEHHIPEDLKGFDPEYIEKIRSCFAAETTEVGMYLAISRQAFREGYPEIGMTLKQIAFEEALHAARFCEILGEKVSTSTMENLKKVVNGELGACALRYEIASYAKKNNYDAVHDSIHDIAKDEARHGKAVVGLLKRYFNVEM